MSLDPTVQVALVGVVSTAVTAGSTAFVGYLNRRATTKVHDEVRTNHGKQAREYLEMIEEVRDGQDAIVSLLADHAKADESNFREIRDRLIALER